MISSLESARLKIVRATEHLNAIKQAIRTASGSDSYEIVFEKDADSKVTVKFRGDPPSEIAIFAGEIVYQIRSALDHLAFDLVKLNPNGITLPADWEEHCLFPLWLKFPKRAPVYNCFEHILPGITKAAFAFIESVQPYNSGPGVRNVLRIIAQLSNVDKHRHLNITVPKVAVHEIVTLTGGMELTSSRGGFKHGAQIETAAGFTPAEDTVDVQRRFTPYVTFDEPTVGDGPATLEVENVLEVSLQHIETVIIPAFTQLLKNP